MKYFVLISFGRRLLWSMVGLYALALGVQVYAVVATSAARSSALPENYGNFEHVRTTLPASDPGAPFTFVVVGDPRSKGTFEALAEDINAAKPDFVVILGDWVDGGSTDWHAYFRRECPEYGFACPVFFTPGNHDVDPKGYGLDAFERDYGPRNFSFVHGDCMFVFISHLDGRFSNRESLDYLRSLAGQDLGKYRKRFVFMHIPPWVSPDIKERHTADEAELTRIFEDLHIDYAVAADFHGYNRTWLRGVEYLVTGGGGSHLHESTGRQFHHAVALTVGPDMVSERILPVAARFDPGDWLEMQSVVRVGPVMFAHPIPFAGANVAAVAGLLWIWVRIRGRRPAVPAAGW